MARPYDGQGLANIWVDQLIGGIVNIDQLNVLYITLGLAVWLFLAIMAAYVATERGRSGIGFFFFSLFLGYLFAILTLIALPKKRPESYYLED